jgi:tetratricopeptide (TPR) repeat protein
MKPGLRLFALLALLLCLPQSARAQEALPARLEALADAGNAEAAYHLGMLYHLGIEGVAVDRRRALDLFRRSADGGNPLGAYKLGCYYAGQGGDVLAPDEALALRYKLIAAEAGYALAQMEVGRIYSNRGEGAQAVRWFEAAARQGDWTALFFAFFQVMPESPQPDRARAWLYFGVMLRTLERIPPDASAQDVRQLRDAADGRDGTQRRRSRGRRPAARRLAGRAQRGHFARRPAARRRAPPRRPSRAGGGRRTLKLVAERALDRALDLLDLALQRLAGTFVARCGVAAMLLGPADGLIDAAFDLVGELAHMPSPPWPGTGISARDLREINQLDRL